MVLLYSQTSCLVLIWWNPTRRWHPVFWGRWGEASIGAHFPIVIKVAAIDWDQLDVRVRQRIDLLEKVPLPCSDIACQERQAPRAIFATVIYVFVSPIMSKEVVILTDKTCSTIL